MPSSRTWKESRQQAPQRQGIAHGFQNRIDESPGPRPGSPGPQVRRLSFQGHTSSWRKEARGKRGLRRRLLVDPPRRVSWRMGMTTPSSRGQQRRSFHTVEQDRWCQLHPGSPSSARVLPLTDDRVPSMCVSLWEREYQEGVRHHAVQPAPHSPHCTPFPGSDPKGLFLTCLLGCRSEVPFPLHKLTSAPQVRCVHGGGAFY